MEIKDKIDVIDEKADEIIDVLGTELIAAQAIVCEQQTVAGKTQWVPVIHSIQVRVAKIAAEGFRAELVQIAELAKVACNARNDVPDFPAFPDFPEPDPLDCDVCEELAIIKANTVRIESKVDVVDDKVDIIDGMVKIVDGKVSIIDDKVDVVDDKVDAVKVDTGLIKDKANAIKSDTEAIERTTNSIQADTGIIRPTSNAIAEDTTLIKTTTDAIKAETSRIKTDTSTIKVAVESRMISVPVVRCEQQTVNNVLTWVSVTQNLEMSAFKETAEAFEQQMKEVAKLTEAECKGRNNKQPEYVAIMPSDIYAEFKLEGRLTLYLIKEEDWPKRGASGSQWSIEIPNPKDSYDWCRDFENLGFQKGNFNCREFWSDSGVRTGAYFSSKQEGTNFLNQVRTLTKATPLRRRITEASAPKSPLYQGRIRVIRAVRTTIVNNVVTSCVTYTRPAGGCQ